MPAVPRNPQLPPVPGDVTDSTYLAQEAQLRAEIARRYNDVLAQLGYTDPGTGRHVLGSVEQQAALKEADLNRNLGLAREGSTNEMRDAGTLFSGYRGTALARAEQPYTSGLASLSADTASTLSGLYGEAGDIVNDYSIRNALLLADLATRRSGDKTTDPDPTPPGPGPTAPPAGARSGVPAAGRAVSRAISRSAPTPPRPEGTGRSLVPGGANPANIKPPAKLKKVPAFKGRSIGGGWL